MLANWNNEPVYHTNPGMDRWYRDPDTGEWKLKPDPTEGLRGDITFDPGDQTRVPGENLGGINSAVSVTAAELGVTEQFLNQIQLLHPWMSGGMLREYVGAYTSEDYGSHELALAYLRTTDVYNQAFRGIRREDGSLRMTESEYFSYVEAVQSDLGQYVNPALFREQIVGLLEGDVSYAEFAQRFATVVDRVLMQAPAIQSAYAEFTGVALTTSAMIAAALDPDLGSAILNKQITMAEVAGTADQRGFDLDQSLAERLVDQGVDLRTSRDLFNRAREIIPILDTLAARHNDPNEDFTIEDFLASDVFSDPTERSRMRRLLESESSLFANAPGFSTSNAMEIVGLTER